MNPVNPTPRLPAPLTYESCESLSSQPHLPMNPVNPSRRRPPPGEGTLAKDLLTYASIVAITVMVNLERRFTGFTRSPTPQPFSLLPW
jgi:hypothetical protein